MSSQAFGKALRLLNSGDFSAVFEHAPFRVSHQHFLILARPNTDAYPRLGLVIAKKSTRLAVDRNRIKRLVRESFRLRQQDLTGLDIVFLSRKGLDGLDNPTFNKQLDQQWRRLLKKTQQAPAQDT